MIVPFKLKRYGAEEYNYLVCPPKPVAIEALRDRMLARAQVVERSYAYRLIDVLHEHIFIQSLDIKADYIAYFSREYTSFGEYLKRRARFPSEIVTKTEQILEESTGIYHFCPSYPFLTDTYGLDLLTRLLEDS